MKPLLNLSKTITSEIATKEQEAFLSSLAPGVTANLYHIINQTCKKFQVKKYMESRSKGFSIVILKDAQLNYKILVQNQDPKDVFPFSRHVGRYLVYKKANTATLANGFIDIPSSAFKHLPAILNSIKNATPNEITLAEHRCVVNYYIQFILNKSVQVKNNTVILPGLDEPVLLSAVNQTLLASLEDILLTVAGVPNYGYIQYNYDENHKTTRVTLLLKEVEDTSSGVYKEELKSFLTTSESNCNSFKVKRYYKDLDNKYVARYHALYKLFKVISKGF